MKYDGGKNLFSRVIPMGTVTFRDAQSLDQIHSCRSTTAHSRSTISSHKYSLIIRSCYSCLPIEHNGVLCRGHNWSYVQRAPLYGGFRRKILRRTHVFFRHARSRHGTQEVFAVPFLQPYQNRRNRRNVLRATQATGHARAP